jgi:UDP-N-acetylglucosamine 2-epimerase (non-hydrolysing)
MKDEGHLRVACVVGARPNFLKIAPLIDQIRRFDALEHVLVHTGQHYDDAMSAVFFRELHIPAPDYNLGVGSGTHTWQTAQVMLALEPLLLELEPACVLVVGDVNSTLAAALVAAKLGITLAHVEAGLRSFDRTMPEEINRQITDAMSDFLFTTSRDANENLRQEGIPEYKIFFVGNVMIDTLRQHRSRAIGLQMPTRYGLAPKAYALLTLHRPSNVDAPAVLGGILDALEVIQAQLPVLFPAHPRTWNRLAEYGLTQRLNGMPDLRLLKPLGYLEFLGLMAEARLVLTDSGGIQEETTILGVPCLTLRENTERPITVSEGTNKVTGTSPQRIVSAANRVLHDAGQSACCPEKWDGRSAARIVSILLEKLQSSK